MKQNSWYECEALVQFDHDEEETFVKAVVTGRETLLGTELLAGHTLHVTCDEGAEVRIESA